MGFYSQPVCLCRQQCLRVTHQSAIHCLVHPIQQLEKQTLLLPVRPFYIEYSSPLSSLNLTSILLFCSHFSCGLFHIQDMTTCESKAHGYLDWNFSIMQYPVLGKHFLLFLCILLQSFDDGAHCTAVFTLETNSFILITGIITVHVRINSTTVTPQAQPFLPCHFEQIFVLHVLYFNFQNRTSLSPKLDGHQHQT